MEATSTSPPFGQSTVSAWAITAPLLATLLAAISAFVWNYALKRRDEKREIRAAARLVDAELSRVEAALLAAWLDFERQASALGRDPGQVLDLSADSEWAVRRSIRRARSHVAGDDDAWTEARMLLGRHLEFNAWDTVRGAYSSVIDWTSSGYHDQLPDSDAPEALPGDALPDRRVAVGILVGELVPLLERIREARAVCQHHADIPPVEAPSPMTHTALADRGNAFWTSPQDPKS